MLMEELRAGNLLSARLFEKRGNISQESTDKKLFIQDQFCFLTKVSSMFLDQIVNNTFEGEATKNSKKKTCEHL